MDAESMHWLVHVKQMHLAAKQLEMEAEVGGPGDDTDDQVAASQQRAEHNLLEMRVERQQHRERGWALMAKELSTGEGAADADSWIEPPAMEAESDTGQTEASEQWELQVEGEQGEAPWQESQQGSVPAGQEVRVEVHWACKEA
ncbi:unnamed protein product [Closterium sp. NIES-53]